MASGNLLEFVTQHGLGHWVVDRLTQVIRIPEFQALLVLVLHGVGCEGNDRDLEPNPRNLVLTSLSPMPGMRTSISTNSKVKRVPADGSSQH
ncbi:MAG: hypothetical protein ACI97A_003492 [Planctomycetota bacterium]|jgi:hypothetical protein